MNKLTQSERVLLMAFLLKECYVDLYVTPIGSLMFNLGCRDSQHCPSGSITGKRQTTNKILSSSCCQGNLCNNPTTNYAGYSATRGPICFNCATQGHYDTCSTIKVCGEHEKCVIRSSSNHHGYFETGCERNATLCVGNVATRTCVTISVCTKACTLTRVQHIPSPVFTARVTTKARAMCASVSQAGPVTIVKLRTCAATRVKPTIRVKVDKTDVSATALVRMAPQDYRCIALCPTWNNLPQNCVLQKKPGECCYHPECNHGITPANVCSYKGKTYNQGQSWQDGCERNCTCENGTTGFYRCIALCPTWNNLPQNCTLQKKPGECCDHPQCPHDITPDSVCVHKGHYYTQGQVWKDGCKYKCYCKDSLAGIYQCTELCLNWGHLPSTCNMQSPAPGMCCPTPQCPPGIKVQYPPGYVQE